ncbi:putative NAD(P)H nitroreductase [Spiroplasma sabaudiense Ar-1343]|uniref:Putative NAD(P)H nitroreductase n=1 Tax=Spiroplasma sabaudiense Ar-1343 TaxID=1276257 RepID=W6A9G7_9MOLU|nr:nitroreductase family protein [Spiroplasma sabaudiense]AHI53672.1 putative NAD(P)H nitroreductase [Spiroplasma sabaudiense Ar-1343]
MSILKDLIKERKTVKRYEKDFKISESDLIEIIDAGRLAPSGFGLQQVEALVFSTDKLKSKVAKAFQGYNEDNINSASALIVLVGIKTKMYEKNNGALIDEKLLNNSKIAEPKRTELKEHLLKVYPNIELKEEYDLMNAAIQIGFMALRATELNLGTTIMTGFSISDLTNVLNELNLLLQGRRPVIALAIGKPNIDFPGNNREKNRIALNEYATFVK